MTHRIYFSCCHNIVIPYQSGYKPFKTNLISKSYQTVSFFSSSADFILALPACVCSSFSSLLLSSIFSCFTIVTLFSCSVPAQLFSLEGSESCCFIFCLQGFQGETSKQHCLRGSRQCRILWQNFKVT